MAASMWEVTRLVLGAPDDAAGIAEAHGFTFEQVTDLLPLFLDNVSTSYGAAHLPAAAPDGAGADALARWLDGWSQQLAEGTVDVVGHDAFGVPELDDPFEAALDDLPDDPADSLDRGTDAAVSFGHGGEGGEESAGGGADAGLDADAGPPDGADPAHDPGTTSDLDLDSPFDLGNGALPDLDGDLAGDHQGADGHPDGTAADGDDGAASFH